MLLALFSPAGHRAPPGLPGSFGRSSSRQPSHGRPLRRDEEGRGSSFRVSNS